MSSEPTRQLMITLRSYQTIRNAMRFPIQSPGSRRDLFWGGFWLLLVPPIGWLLNMGHRIVVVHRMLNGSDNPWPAWSRPGELLRHGMITFAGMALYHLPASVVGFAAGWFDAGWLWLVAGVLWVAGTCVVPGYMTAYCVNYNATEVFDVARSVRRVLRAGPAYWKAWGIALVALGVSFIGLLGLGVLFFWTSVWFWQAAAFGFAKALSAEPESR